MQPAGLNPGEREGSLKVYRQTMLTGLNPAMTDDAVHVDPLLGIHAQHLLDQVGTV